MNSVSSIEIKTHGYRPSFIMNGMFHVLAVLDLNGIQGKRCHIHIY